MTEVAVAGAGGVGSYATIFSAQLGHQIRIADFDKVEKHNVLLNQPYEERHVGQLKVNAVKELVRSCTTFILDFRSASALQLDQWVGEARIVAVAIDGFQARLRLADWAYRRGLVVVEAAMDPHGAPHVSIAQRPFTPCTACTLRVRHLQMAEVSPPALRNTLSRGRNVYCAALLAAVVDKVARQEIRLPSVRSNLLVGNLSGHSVWDEGFVAHPTCSVCQFVARHRNGR